MCNLLRQGHRLLVSRQSLIRIAKMPQRPRVKGTTSHTSVVPMEERVDTVLLVIECYALGIMRVRSNDRAQIQ